MKKLLLIVLLMISSLFADTFYYKKKIFFCNTITIIQDNSGKNINTGHLSNSHPPSEHPPSDESIPIKYKVGGGLIALGGLFLLDTIKECGDCTLSEENKHSKRVKKNSQIGYGLILLGSLIIAIGE